MAHKTLINGTAYEISGGKTLVDGTGYEISKGATLVDGAAYEIPFGAQSGITIRLGGTVSGSEDFAHICFNAHEDGAFLCITSDGKVRFESPAGYLLETITDTAFFALPIGSNIDCYVKSGGIFADARIRVNNAIVAQKRNGAARYEYSTVGRAIIYLVVTQTVSGAVGTIEIIEE